MAQPSEQAMLIASLQAKGYSIKDIAGLTGRTPRYIQHARDSVIKTGRGGKLVSGKGQNLVPALKQLDEKGKLSPAQIPGARKTRAGTKAKVRTGTKTVTTKKGVTSTVTNVKRGPATLKRAIADAAKGNKRVRWDVHGKVKSKSDRKGRPGWVSGHLPSGWNAQMLLDRINNPHPSDGWKAGDVNAALAEIAVGQNNGVTGLTAMDEFNLFVSD